MRAAIFALIAASSFAGAAASATLSAEDRRHIAEVNAGLAFEVTPGQLGDVRVALALLGPLLVAALCAADTAYDSNGLRQFLIERGTLPVIPNNPTRKQPHPFHRPLYRERNLIERMFCR